jgi:hypothetical protein
MLWLKLCVTIINSQNASTIVFPTTRMFHSGICRWQREKKEKTSQFGRFFTREIDGK